MTEQTATARERIEEFRHQVDDAIDATPAEIDLLLVLAAVQGRMQREAPADVRNWLANVVRALDTGELALAEGGRTADDQAEGGA